MISFQDKKRGKVGSEEGNDKEAGEEWGNAQTLAEEWDLRDAQTLQ